MATDQMAHFDEGELGQAYGLAPAGDDLPLASDDLAPGRTGAVAVLVVEEDVDVLHQLLRPLRDVCAPVAFLSLDEANGAHLPPEEPVVLVLGPSQATAASLGRVGMLLRGPRGTGAILVVDRASAEIMRTSLRAGISDALQLAEVPELLAVAVSELADKLADDLAMDDRGYDRPPGLSSRRGGTVTTIFSPKGGVGKSVIAVNLAVGLAMRTNEAVAILDLDVQFGDVAVMMRLQPRHTLTDAVSAGTLLDEALLRSFLARHEKSGVLVLAAPTSPSEADQIDAASMLRVLGLLRGMFAHVVVDTAPHLSELVLQAVSASDDVGVVVTLEVPSVKNARLGLQAFELLQIPPSKVLVILNRAGSRVHLGDHDVERALGLKVDVLVPSEVVVPQSINQGAPAVLGYPRSRFAAALNQLAELVLARAEQRSCRESEGRP